jgi:hypothetical protein
MYQACGGKQGGVFCHCRHNQVVAAVAVRESDVRLRSAPATRGNLYSTVTRFPGFVSDEIKPPFDLSQSWRSRDRAIFFV